MVTFSNNVEPANGFLVRYLHRKAVEAKQKEKVHDPAGHQALLSVLDWVPQLWYHLHAFLEKHSTSDFLIGTETHNVNPCQKPNLLTVVLSVN
jgi:neuron navigator 1